MTIDASTSTPVQEHAGLISEMKLNDKLPVEERIRLAKQNRKAQLDNYNTWTNEDGGQQDGDRQQKLVFSEDVYLMDAASKGAMQDMMGLLRKGMDPNTSNHEGLTALHQCCIDGSEDMARLLLQHGASVNASDKDGWTPLHAAATCGHLNIVQMLVGEGASLLAVNGDCDMPFDITENEETLSYIEEAMTKEGITQEKVTKKRAELHDTMVVDVQMLIDEGLGLNMAVNEDGGTLLHVAIVNQFNDVVELLLDNEATDEVEDVEGWRPAHAAAFWGNKVALDLLAQDKSTDLRAVTHSGMTPFDLSDDAEVKRQITKLINENPEKYANNGHKNRDTKKKGSSASTSSESDEFEETSQIGPLQFVTGKTTKDSTDPSGSDSDDGDESSSSSNIADEALGTEAPTSIVRGIDRVESISRRRNSVREAKKQAPMIRIGQLHRHDSNESYDNSYDLILNKPQKVNQQPENYQADERTTEVVQVSVNVDVANSELIESREEIVETNHCESLENRRSSSSSSSSSESDAEAENDHPYENNFATNNYSTANHENIYENSTEEQSRHSPVLYENATELQPTGNIYENSSSNSTNFEVDRSNTYEEANMYESYDDPPDGSSLTNEMPPVPASPTSNPETLPRTIFSNISNTQPDKKTVKTPKQSSPEITRKPAPKPPQTTLAFHRPSTSSSSSSSSFSNSDTFPLAGTSNPTSPHSRSQHQVVPPNMKPVSRRPNYVPLADSNRPTSNTAAKGSLAALKLRRQKSRPLSFDQGPPSFTTLYVEPPAYAELYAAADSRQPQPNVFEPQNTPTMVRHVFKDPNLDLDYSSKRKSSKKSIFSQKKRCVLM